MPQLWSPRPGARGQARMFRTVPGGAEPPATDERDGGVEAADPIGARNRAPVARRGACDPGRVRDGEWTEFTSLAPTWAARRGCPDLGGRGTRLMLGGSWPM